MNFRTFNVYKDLFDYDYMNRFTRRQFHIFTSNDKVCGRYGIYMFYWGLIENYSKTDLIKAFQDFRK